MNCREAQAEIALYAGGDLDDRARVRDLRQHVRQCGKCRAHYDSMKSTLKSLAAVGPASSAATWERAGSLWPSIRREIAQPPQTLTTVQAVNQLKNWTPFAAMTAACVLMLVALGQFGAPPDEPVSGRGMAPHPPMVLQMDDEPEEKETEDVSEGRSYSPGRDPSF